MACVTPPTPPSPPEHLDVLLVGAGLSGINAAYRLQTECPTKTWAILEGRDDLGGTWDLFRYPGIRSDSDMATLGFPFEPWSEADAIAEGGEILDYIRRTAVKHGIEERIRLGHQVVAADWSSDDARWTATVQTGARTIRLTCSFLSLCSGYYEYDSGHRPDLPGEERFRGQVVHPQFWPDDLETDGARIVVIGSGATAMTLVPALAERGAHVTMLQRSQTWVTALPRRDRVADAVRRLLPERPAGVLVRYKNVLSTMAFYQLSRRRPRWARALLLKGIRRGLADTPEADRLVAEHLTPSYDPWDQRLCVVPDGDLFDALREGRAEIVTDTLDTFTEHGLRLSSGREIEADVVVTATGLRILAAGGVDISVDGERRPASELWVYRGLMLGGVPNLALSIGYVNASWTLRSDLAARYVCRLLGHLDAQGLTVAVPTPPPDLVARPLLPLGSGYVQRALPDLPRQGDRAPWLMRQNYLLDRREMLRGDVTEDMSFR